MGFGGLKLCIFSRVPFSLAAGLSLSLKMMAEHKLNDSWLHNILCATLFSHILQDCYITLGVALVHFGVQVEGNDFQLPADPSIMISKHFCWKYNEINILILAY